MRNKHIGSSFETHFNSRMLNTAFAELYNQEKIKYDIAELVKFQRKKAGLTQRQLAEISGLKQSAIARIESRTAKMIPSIETLRRIFVPLGFNVTVRLDSLKKAA
jgi:ribosome-binding protein aMBF1 (putative translation factor)